MQDFYKCLNIERSQNLLNLAKQMFSLFGSTYICEQTVSVINFNKSKQRSSLTDRHSEDILKISSSHIVPNYGVLVADKTCNISHQTSFLRFVLTIDLLSMLAMNLTFR